MASKVKKSVPGMSKKDRVEFLEDEVKRLRAELVEAKAVNSALDSQLSGYTSTANTINGLTETVTHLSAALEAHTGLRSFMQIVLNAADRGLNLSPAAIRQIHLTSKEAAGDDSDRGSKLVIVTDGTSPKTRVYTLGKTGLELVGMISSIHLEADTEKMNLEVSLPKTSAADSVTAQKLARVRTLLLTVPNLSVKV
jgi:hypothetical protein